jgi:hypothetical protein
VLETRIMVGFASSENTSDIQTVTCAAGNKANQQQTQKFMIVHSRHIFSLKRIGNTGYRIDSEESGGHVKHSGRFAIDAQHHSPVLRRIVPSAEREDGVPHTLDLPFS